jgi:hypothetical protein
LISLQDTAPAKKKIGMLVGPKGADKSYLTVSDADRFLKWFAARSGMKS